MHHLRSLIGEGRREDKRQPDLIAREASGHLHQ